MPESASSRYRNFRTAPKPYVGGNVLAGSTSGSSSAGPLSFCSFAAFFDRFVGGGIEGVPVAVDFSIEACCGFACRVGVVGAVVLELCTVFAFFASGAFFACLPVPSIWAKENSGRRRSLSVSRSFCFTSSLANAVHKFPSSLCSGLAQTTAFRPRERQRRRPNQSACSYQA